VVASTDTGAALWHNPAGIARVDESSLELTGVTIQMQVVRIPGLLTLKLASQAPARRFFGRDVGWRQGAMVPE